MIRIFRAREPRLNPREKFGTNPGAGFTMIEMMVVLAIIGLLTVGVVGNYGSFRSATVATNMAYELAGSIRQAQLYGLGVRLDGRTGTVDGESNPNDTYGVELAKNSPTYSIFRELGTPDGRCGNEGANSCNCAADENECVEQVTMLQKVTVAALCTGNAAMTGEELLSGGNCGHETLALSYTRPNPETLIHAGATTGHTLAGIVIRGGTHCRLVRVYQNGQVAVESVPASAAGILAPACGA